MTTNNTELQFYPIDFKHLVDDNINKVADYLQKIKRESIDDLSITFALNHNLQLIITNTDDDLIGFEILDYQPNSYKDYKTAAKALLTEYQSRLKDRIANQRLADLPRLFDILCYNKALFSEDALIDYLVSKLDRINFELDVIAIKNKHYLLAQVVSHWQEYQHLSVNVLNSLLTCINYSIDDPVSYLLFSAIEEYFNKHRDEIAKSRTFLQYGYLINNKIKLSDLSQEMLNLPLHAMVEEDVYDVLHKYANKVNNINITFQIEDEKDLATFTDILLQACFFSNNNMYSYLNKYKNMISLNGKKDMVAKRATDLSNDFKDSYLLKKLADIFNLLLTVLN